MTIATRFRSMSDVSTTEVDDTTLYDTYVPIALARVNNILETSYTVTNGTTEDGWIDDIVVTLTCAVVYKDLRPRLTYGPTNMFMWEWYEQTAYRLMAEIRPDKFQVIAYGILVPRIGSARTVEPEILDNTTGDVKE